MPKTVNKTVLGGVFMAHAPQFFTLPKTEDKKTVTRIKRLAKSNGQRLRGLKPDLIVTVSNDHANQFALHCVPPFVIHRGNIARGGFAGKTFEYKIANKEATSLIRYLYEESFDVSYTSTAEVEYSLGIPLEFLDIGDIPILPIFVNAYIPPQPRIERCYAFGEAIRRGLAAQGLKVVVMVSGGMSHFPGTERYAEPDLEFDKKVLGELSDGNLRYLLALDEKRLDDSGNIELRCWGVGAGMLGERKPDKLSLDPSWHHNYATLAWWSDLGDQEFRPHYPSIAPERIELSKILHRLANETLERDRYTSDPKNYVKNLNLTPSEKVALIELSDQKFIEMGVHPFMSFMARLHIERANRSTK
ncbi:MAG: hypothetical protein VW226_09380 [Rhodospirillaceae bacterium]